MTRKEETYVLDTLIEIQDFIRSPTFKQLVKETHENNIMLRQIIRVINTHNARHHQENEDDFVRNVLANTIANYYYFKIYKQEVSGEPKVLVLDWIPVQRVSDDKWGFYDKITKNFYPSEGSEEFSGG